MAAILGFSYLYFFQGGGGNQNVRMLQTQALVDDGSFAIDAYRDDAFLGGVLRPFVLTNDWARHDGHFYPNANPGLSLLAVPSFALADAILRATIPYDPQHRAQWDAYFATVWTVGVMAVLLGLILMHTLNGLLGMSLRASFWMAACFGLGTLAFSYATVFRLTCRPPRSASRRSCWPCICDTTKRPPNGCNGGGRWASAPRVGWPSCSSRRAFLSSLPSALTCCRSSAVDGFGAGRCWPAFPFC